MAPGFQTLDVAVIGGGIGGLATATSLRRAGHQVTIYERAHYAGEIGASISCAANGTQWLVDWDVDVSLGKPVVLQSLIHHNWKTGAVESVYGLEDYEEKWGNVYNMFHRVDMHKMLMESATSERGAGPPAKLVLDHACSAIDLETGEVTFKNGAKAQHDLVIGADGIGSAVRGIIGIAVEKKQSDSSCYHCIVPTSKVRALGLKDLTPNAGIEFWGGQGKHKIVFSPCREGEICSFYCFFPANLADNSNESWTSADLGVDQLIAPFPDLDPELIELFKSSEDIKPWRLWVHTPYTHLHKGVAAILGDAAHPMMPDQSQGACQALEDAAALGIIFSKDFGFTQDVKQGLALYEKIRKPRVTKVQAASARARENIAERIGFSSAERPGMWKVADENSKLTIDEMNEYNMRAHIEQEVKGNVQIQAQL